MTELFTAEQFIKTTLSADTTLQGLVSDRVHNSVAPSPVYPIVIFSELSSRDVNGIGAVRIATRPLYLVKAVGMDSGFAAIDPIAQRIDELLHGAHIELESGVIFSCLREQPFSDAEVDGSNVSYHRGGIYRIMVH